MTTIRLEASDYTENLIQYITAGLNDEQLDEIEVERDVEKPTNLVTEPITTAATLTLGLATITAVTRLIERWLETKRQLATLNIISNANTDQEKKVLSDIAKSYTNVSIKYGLTKESWTNKK